MYIKSADNIIKTLGMLIYKKDLIKNDNIYNYYIKKINYFDYINR